MSVVHLKVHGRIEADGHLRLMFRLNCPRVRPTLQFRSVQTKPLETRDMILPTSRVDWLGAATPFAEQRGIRNEW